MKNRLYISDLDGTLLNSSAKLSETTKHILNLLMAQGVQFTYATARSYSSAHPIIQDLDLALPSAAYNGAFLFAPDGTIVDYQLIPGQAVKLLFEKIRKIGLYPMVFTLQEGVQHVSWVDGKQTAGISRYITDRKGDKRLRGLSCYEDLWRGEVFNITMISHAEEIETLRKVICEIPGLEYNIQFDTYHTQDCWCDIFSKEATKANAVQRLKKLSGAEELICFGDNLNDLSMFRVSDECYAVANAKPAVKEQATGIIQSNDMDGVAKFIYEHHFGTSYIADGCPKPSLRSRERISDNKPLSDILK